MIFDIPTDKYGDRHEEAKPSFLIIHSIGMPTASALELLTRSPREVSCHYLIAQNGTVYRMVPEEKRAWHAGKSWWRGLDDLNSHSIGIELGWSEDKEANEETDIPGPFTEEQMTALIELSQEIITRWSIPLHNVLAHSDIAPSRKRDPGPRFDWARMGAAGVALHPTRPLPLPSSGDVTPLLKRYGYDVTDPEAALIAFQKHFRPRSYNGIADSETRSLLEWLLKKVGR